jgi:hypothetical protein
VVSIANTEIQLLQFVLGEVGAGKITRKRTISERHSPSFCDAVTSRQALWLLGQVTCRMRSYKRALAELALRFEAAFLALTSTISRGDETL